MFVISAQSGKALALDTPLPTPTGWTTMGDVQVGDQLFDESGKPCRVTALSPIQEGRTCYRVVFGDGNAIVADAEHRWSVEPYVGRRRPGPVVMTTAELLRDLHTVRADGRRRNNWCVPAAGPLDLSEADLPISPYVLGLWLGDGHTYSSAITVGTQDRDATVALLEAEGARTVVNRTGTGWNIRLDPHPQDGSICGYTDANAYGRALYHRRKHGTPMQGRPVTMYGRLAALGVIGRKHVPATYMRASIAQRFALLQGLMDSDGHAGATGQCEFCTTNTDLAQSVYELVVSLGLKPRLAESVATLNNRIVGPKYRVTFVTYRDTRVFRLERKQARLRVRGETGTRPSESGRRFIERIEPVESVSVKCVAVDSPTHLYLAGRGMIPTHNSETILDIIGQRLDEQPAPILYVGPNKQFIQEQWEPRIMALLDEAPTLADKVARGKRMTKTRKVIAGVPLRLAHAGSSTALKSDPASLALTDEADELMANIKGQGDPIGLIDARGDTYADFVHAMVSTTSIGPKETERDPVSGLWFWKVQPAETIGSTVWKFWQSGTRYHWTWKCPHCGERFVPRFDCLGFDGKGDELNTTQAKARASAHVVCPNHDCIITNEHKAWMNDTGVEVAPGQALDDNGDPHGPPPVSDTWSLWTSGLCSPFQSFGDRAAKYVEAVQTGDPAKIQTVVNAAFGELWMASGGDVPNAEEVATRKLPYKRGDVPAGVLLLTAGVDVQKDRLFFVIRGWGTRQESWLIDHGEIFDDTRLDSTWLKLSRVLERNYDGLHVMRAFVDSGFRPGKRNAGDENAVYEFCRRHSRLAYPTKGYEQRSAPISVNSIDVTPVGDKPSYGLDLVRLDSDYLKAWVHSRIRWPLDHPGGWHIPGDTEDGFCRQIVSEARMSKPGGGFTWTRLRPDNHYLDCEALAFAAAKMLGLDQIPDDAPPPERLAPPKELPSSPASDPKPEPAPGPTPDPPRPTEDWYGDRTDGWFDR